MRTIHAEVATRKKVKARIALFGTSGSGKTYSALTLAKELGETIVLIDTENNSASCYSQHFPFYTINFEPPYSPEDYIEHLNYCTPYGGFVTHHGKKPDVVIIDSITPEWTGEGGILEINDLIAKTKFRGNSFAAWADSTPRHNRFLNTIIHHPCHTIVTLRSSTKWVETTADGKKNIKKIGAEPKQRDGFEYEFTIAFEMAETFAICSKDRTGIFTNLDPFIITSEHGKKLSAWLAEGVDESDNATERLVELLQDIAKLSPEHHEKLSAWLLTKGIENPTTINPNSPLFLTIRDMVNRALSS